MSRPGFSESVLVDAAWTMQHLTSPQVRIVEVDMDNAAYADGHLQGAVAWSWSTQLTDPVRRDIPSRESLSALLRSSGIGPETTVVLYGSSNNWFATWAYWLLKMHGHADVRMLDGGRRYWTDHMLPIASEIPVPQPTTYELPEPDQSIRILRDEVISRLGEDGLVLVDVRSLAENSGEVIAPPGMTETAQRGGHIPGAVLVPMTAVLRPDGTFKKASDLRDLYESRGVTPDQKVVTYCRIGERSSHSWFVLHELLGYPEVRNYDGSWTEWGSMIGVPIERESAFDEESIAVPAAD